MTEQSASMEDKCESCEALRGWLSEERNMVATMTSKLEATRKQNVSLRKQLKSVGCLDADVVAKAVAEALDKHLKLLIPKTVHTTVKALRDGCLIEISTQQSEASNRSRVSSGQKTADNSGRHR